MTQITQMKKEKKAFLPSPSVLSASSADQPPSVRPYPTGPAVELLFPDFLAVAVKLKDLTAVSAGHQDPAIGSPAGPGRPGRLAPPDHVASRINLHHLMPAAAADKEMAVGQQLDTA